MNYFNKLNESVRKKFKINDQFLNKYDLTEIDYLRSQFNKCLIDPNTTLKKLMKLYKRVSKNS